MVRFSKLGPGAMTDKLAYNISRAQLDACYETLFPDEVPYMYIYSDIRLRV